MDEYEELEPEILQPNIGPMSLRLNMLGTKTGRMSSCMAQFKAGAPAIPTTATEIPKELPHDPH